MERWDTTITAQKEFVPEWLVEIAQLWTSQSATDPRYQEEYQQIRRLARASHVPPFVVTLRMMRDTYQVTKTTTWEQFKERMDRQIAADGGQMLMSLTTLPSEEEQRAAYAQELEEQAAKAVAAMREAIETNDDQKFKAAAAESGKSQQAWLVVAQHMTPEQAHEIMTNFALNEVTRWMEKRIPGPPPLIFDRYKKKP